MYIFKLSLINKELSQNNVNHVKIYVCSIISTLIRHMLDDALPILSMLEKSDPECNARCEKTHL